MQETDAIKPRNTLLNAEEENLQNLSFLNEPEMLTHLRSRYEKNLIFTYTGPILLSINPFDEVVPSPSCVKLIQRYTDQVRYEAASAPVLSTGSEIQSKHSIIISGESGSGKSECCKLILNALGSRRGADHALASWFSNLLLSNKLLESFGSARTMKTTNSSRFGKVVEVKLNPAGELTGSVFKTYLLESSRVANQQQNERNFNIFYQLIAGASSEEARRWKLLPADTFKYINQGGVCYPNGKREDALKFKELKDSMVSLGFAGDLSSSLFDLLAGIMALGQISFEALDDMSGGCRVINAEQEDGPLQVAAQLIGVSHIQLEELLTSKLLVSPRGEAIKRKLPMAQAIAACDAVAKGVYKTVFDWVVAIINERLVSTMPGRQASSSPSDREGAVTPSKTHEHITIAVVDIFGLDALEYNSIDQLCINYANEALHQFFNHHMFKLEIELYKAEEINYENFDFPDNQENLNLIGNGIFKVLDDQCKLPNPTDKRLVAQLYKEYSNHPLFTVSTFQNLESKFTIIHFAGPVEYTVDNFIQKNMDNMPMGTGAVLSASANHVLINIVQNSTSANRRRATFLGPTGAGTKVSAPSFVAQVKMDLALLLKEIETTTPHYVKCFKPFDREIDAEALNARTLSVGASNAATITTIMPPTPPSPKPIIQSSSNKNANRSLPTPPTPKPLVSALKKEKDPKSIAFSQVKVAEQLRYSGILDAVRIGRVGFRTRLPYVEFYNRYRILANDLTEVEFDGPAFAPHDITAERSKELAKALLVSLSATAASSGDAKPSDKLERMQSRRVSRTNSMQLILREASVATLRGVLDGNNLQLGKTLVFMHKKEHDILESLRNSTLRNYVTLIQKNYRTHYAVKLFRKRLRMRYRAVLTLQRKFRWMRFYFRIVALQCLYRRFIAHKKLQDKRERRAKLLALYGPLIVSREMRIKRRRDFVDQAKESINGILVPEIRIAECKIREDELLREILELVAESKVQDGGDFDFYKLIDILSARIRALKNNEYKIAMVQFIRSLIPAEHMLRTWELTNNTVIGNLVGPLFWKIFYKGDIPDVHLTPRHQMFMPIDRMIGKTKHVLSLTDSESHNMELQRQQMRQFGVSRNSSSARRRNSDAMINKINAQIHNILKIQNLLSLFSKYYTTYMSNFCLEYGEGSHYHKGFTNEKLYVKDLLLKIESAQIDKPLRKEKDNDTLYSVSKCRLKVEWKDTLENMRSGVETVVPKNRYSEDDNDILRKLADLERSRKDFTKDILRIVEHNNVGYQYMPHSPGISFAINSFFNLVCERFLPPRRLIKLMGTRQMEGKVAYYQAAPFMSNTSFLDVIYNPVAVEQLDLRTYTAAMMTSLLLGLSHLQPNHILVNMNKSSDKAARSSLKRESKIGIYGFNSDSLTQACFLDFQNPIRNRIHGYNLNVLYFMPQMDEAIDPDIKAFLSSSPFICEELVMSWLRDLHEQNVRYQVLKAAGFNSNDFKALNLPIQLSKGSVLEVYKRLKAVVHIIVNAGKEESNNMSLADMTVAHREFKLTHQDLLSEVSPTMSDFYSERRHNSDFTEGIDFKGVVSYAYVYHQALESERDKVVVRKGTRFSILNVTGQPNLSATPSEENKTDASNSAKGLDQGVEEHKRSSNPGRRVQLTTPDKVTVDRAGALDEEPIRMTQDEYSEHSETRTRSDPDDHKPVLVAHPSLRLSYGNIYDGEHDRDSESIVYEAPPTPFKKIQSNMVLRTSVPRHVSSDLNYDIFGATQDASIGTSENLKFMSAPEGFKNKMKSGNVRADSLQRVDGDGNKMGARMSALSEAVEDEALDFLTQMDFRDFAEIRPIGRATEFCELIGKNMAFMPTLWFNFINEWQLKAVFGFWFRLQELSSLDNSKLKLQTTEVILRFDSEEQMQAMKDCKLLTKLQKKLKITVKFAILTASVDENGNLLPSNPAASTMVDVNTEQDAGHDLSGQSRNRVLTKLTSDEQYDVYCFMPTSEDIDEDEDSEDESTLNAPERESKKRLMHILWSCENLMQESDMDKLEEEIRIIKRVVTQVVVPTAHDVEIKLISNFCDLLLQYPGLAPIGVVVAERHGFAQHKDILHKLLNHAFVERYVDVVIALLECHPDVLLLVDPETSFLPCDRLKKFPDSKACKYHLLAKFVNFAGESAQRHYQSMEVNSVYDILSRSKGIFSNYRGEEELIVRAAHYGLPATEMELKVRRYDMTKRCDAKNEPLLLKLLVDDIKGDETSRAEAYLTFALFAKAVDERIASGTMTTQEAEEMMWKDVDMNNLTPADCIEYGLNQTNLERSGIFQELNHKWNPPVRRLTTRTLSRRISKMPSTYSMNMRDSVTREASTTSTYNMRESMGISPNSPGSRGE